MGTSSSGFPVASLRADRADHGILGWNANGAPGASASQGTHVPESPCPFIRPLNPIQTASPYRSGNSDLSTQFPTVSKPPCIFFQMPWKGDPYGERSGAQNLPEPPLYPPGVSCTFSKAETAFTSKTRPLIHWSSIPPHSDRSASPRRLQCAGRMVKAWARTLSAESTAIKAG